MNGNLEDMTPVLNKNKEDGSPVGMSNLDLVVIFIIALSLVCMELRKLTLNLLNQNKTLIFSKLHSLA